MKKTYIFAPIFLIAVFVITIISPMITMSEDISSKVFRLHILANSDEDFDQQLKLYVRDEILNTTNDIFSNCSSVDDAVIATSKNLETIIDTANKAIESKGYNYKAMAYVTKEFFDTRVYDGFTLPAGYYDTLMIEIGEGRGHNWWCVMYPSVCLSGCTDDLRGELSDEEMTFVTSDKYIVKFKIVEIYEKIKLDIKDKIY